MSKAVWDQVDTYFTDLLHTSDPILESTLKSCSQAGLPDIQVSATQGKWLHLMVKMCRAQRVLELGTLGAYSTIWMARALPESGRLVTLESEAMHAKVARKNLEQAGLADRVELREGLALETLEQMVDAKTAPFDLIFLDADKENYPHYLPGLLQLSRPGTLLIADNIVRDGAVVDSEHLDPRVQGVRQFNQSVANDPRIDATGIQTVGVKGYDGYLMGIVN